MEIISIIRSFVHSKIRLHRKSSLHLKLQQQELLHHHAVHRNKAKNSLYDDLHLHHHHHNFKLQQLMQQPLSSASSDSSVGGSPAGTPSDAVGGGSAAGGDGGLSSNCDFSPISGGQAGGFGADAPLLSAATVGTLKANNRGGSVADTVINLSSDEFSHHQVKNHHHNRNKSKDLNESELGSLVGNTTTTLASSSLLEGAATSSGGAGVESNIGKLPSLKSDPKITGLMDCGNRNDSQPLLLGKSTDIFANRLPKVSILKPLMGIDTNLEANLESFFTMAYPRQCYEVLFCVESKDDPVLALCQSLIEKYKGEVDARLFIGGAHVGVNPKINNMEPGYREAKYELIMISDAGIKSEL